MTTSDAHTPPGRRRALARLAVLLLGATVCVGTAAAADGPLIAVAANMAGATAAIVERFEAHTGVPVRTSVGASGNLARQILRGAPFELFVSADDEYPRRVAEAGLARRPPVHYASGHLELVIRASLPAPAAGATTTRLRAALSNPAIRRLAIATPEHAPYGRAAREALRALGLWEALHDRLVMGESVSQTARFATTGAVQAALLPTSLAREPVFADATRLPVPGDLHAPIRQHMVLLRNAGDDAARLFDFVLGADGRAVLAGHGYALPARD